MWPLMIAFGVYLTARGIQEGIEYNRHQRTLPPPRSSIIDLELGDDFEILDDTEFLKQYSNLSRTDINQWR